jgi:hypothetical protein
MSYYILGATIATIALIVYFIYDKTHPIEKI